MKSSDGEQVESDLRQLEFKKNQYGPLGESMVLRYQHGLFLPEAGVSDLDRAGRTAKAREQGKKFGRPSALDAGQRRKIADRYAAGETMAELAREYECGEATIWRALKAA